MTSDNIRGSTSKDVREPADWPVWRCPERWMSSSVCVFVCMYVCLSVCLSVCLCVCLEEEMESRDRWIPPVRIRANVNSYNGGADVPESPVFVNNNSTTNSWLYKHVNY